MKRYSVLAILLAVLLLFCACSAPGGEKVPVESREQETEASSAEPVSSKAVSSEAVSSEPASSEPEISSEPASSEAEASSEAVSSAVSVSSAAAESKAESKVESKAESKVESKVESKAESKVESKVESKAESKVESQAPVVNVVPETASGDHYHNDINAQYAGNVLICGDYALEYFGSAPGGSAGYAQMVSAFAKKYPNVQVTSILVPKSCAFHAPKGYNDQYENQKQFIANTYSQMGGSVLKADVIGKMTPHRDEYLFYRTDHHWTSLGAYYASVAFCEANGITPRALESYETHVNPGFLGTLYSFSTAGNLRENLKRNLDYTVAHMPQTKYTMTYQNSGVTYEGVAVNPNKISYAGMFMCGDQPLTDIKTANKNGKKIIVFKESYGNAFIPYLIDYFEEIVVVDIRYATKGTAALIQEYGITHAAIINNVQAAISLSGSLQKKLIS